MCSAQQPAPGSTPPTTLPAHGGDRRRQAVAGEIVEHAQEVAAPLRSRAATLSALARSAMTKTNDSAATGSGTTRNTTRPTRPSELSAPQAR